MKSSLTKKITALCLLGLSLQAFSQEKSKQDWAKEAVNPLTSLTYVPLQLDHERNIGPDDDGERLTLNVQPLTSFELSNDWNLISRTIVPIVYQEDIYPDAGDQFGLGDSLQSFFFSPKEDIGDGWIWGVGPALLAPTATDDDLAGDKWAVGPTAVIAKSEGPWTLGLLANHLASFAGKDDATNVNDTFIQPFIDYTTEEGVTFEVTTESNYSWTHEEWSIPLIFTINKLTQIGDQMIIYGGGLRYWADGTEDDPEGLSFTFSLYFLFPN